MTYAEFLTHHFVFILLHAKVAILYFIVAARRSDHGTHTWVVWWDYYFIIKRSICTKNVTKSHLHVNQATKQWRCVTQFVAFYNETVVYGRAYMLKSFHFNDFNGIKWVKLNNDKKSSYHLCVAATCFVRHSKSSDWCKIDRFMTTMTMATLSSDFHKMENQKMWINLLRC